MIALVLLAALLPLPRIHHGEPPAGFEKVPPPDIEMKMSQASATTVPWIDANGWRFLRGLKKAHYAELPPGRSPLAAAEAFAYGVEALLDPKPEDDGSLKAMLAFLDSVNAPPLPTRGNIVVVDDNSDEIPEVLNMLARRNLLYRVASKPVNGPDLVVRLGTKQYPRSAAEDPNDFAARVREKITDDKRVVRLFGTYTVIAHLTGDGKRARLHLLNYSRRPVDEMRVRVVGRYRAVRMAEAHDRQQSAADITHEPSATEFTVPRLTTYAVVDLEP